MARRRRGLTAKPITRPVAAAAPAVYTIGHSTRTIDELIAVLDAHGIELVADVRRFPASRRLPQFASESLAASLASHGIAYEWFPALGGRRRPSPDSPHTGWRHPAFRAYADHVQSEEFADGLFALVLCAGGLRTAVMCAEVLWWRCHRRLIADVLVSLGYEVLHIRDASPAEPHRLTAPARLVLGQLRYSTSETTMAEGIGAPVAPSGD